MVMRNVEFLILSTTSRDPDFRKLRLSEKYKEKLTFPVFLSPWCVSRPKVIGQNAKRVRKLHVKSVWTITIEELSILLSLTEPAERKKIIRNDSEGNLEFKKYIVFNLANKLWNLYGYKITYEEMSQF